MSATSQQHIANRGGHRGISRRGSEGRKVFTSRPSQKVGAVALAGAISTLCWTLLATYATTHLSTDVVATLTGATTTIFAFALGYLIPE